MTPAELAKAAADSINRGLTKTMLVLPRPATGRRRMRVFGGKGQKSLFGEVACENADGRTCVWVDSMDLLAWLAAAGLIEVREAS